MSQRSITLEIYEIKKEIDDYFSIYFKKPKNFVYHPGDCFDLIITKDAFREKRIFSFSSSPTERLLQITYRKGISQYKKYLENMTKGDTLELLYFGNQYSFYYEKPLVFFAGGIGITVFKSALQYAIDNKLQPSINLLFINKTDRFPFMNILDEYKKFLNLTIHYYQTSKEGRLTKDKLKEILPSIMDIKYEYYIAGPPLMVDSTSDLLRKFGIDDKTIHTDSFDGYLEETR